MWCQNKAIKGGGRLVFQVTVVVATPEMMILLGSLREREGEKLAKHHSSSSSIAKRWEKTKESQHFPHLEPSWVVQQKILAWQKG